MIRRLLALCSIFLWGCASQPTLVPRSPRPIVEPDWRFHEARLTYPIWREKMAIYDLCTEDFPPRSASTLRWCLRALGPPPSPSGHGHHR